MYNEGTVQACILNQDRYEIICGCCGATIESGDFVILDVYIEWQNITDEICGDDGDILHEIEKQVDRMTASKIKAIRDKKEDFPDGFLN